MELTKPEQLLYQDFMKTVTLHNIPDKHVLKVLSYMIGQFKRWNK